MNDLNNLTAGMILHSSRALAGYAASELFETHPDLRDCPPPGEFGKWQGLLAGCLEELAAALAANRPVWFAEYAQWMQSVLHARGVPDNALAHALESLRHVLAAELPPEARSLAAEMCANAIERLCQPPAEPPTSSIDPASPHGRLAGLYLIALLEGDADRAARLILEAVETGQSVPELCQYVLMAALQEVGRMWQQGEINVAEEHFVSATTKAVLLRLRDHLPRKEANGRVLLAAAVAGNHHDIGLHALAELFELDGWRVIQLGSNVPIGDLVEAVDFYRADLLALSASLRTQLAVVKQTIRAVRAGNRGAAVKILVGGRAFDDAGDLAAEIGADGYAADPVQAVALGSTLTASDT